MPAAKEGRPHREYGFVHFTERATAVKLVDDAEKGIKPSLDGNTLEARPVAASCLRFFVCGMGRARGEAFACLCGNPKPPSFGARGLPIVPKCQLLYMLCEIWIECC